MAGGVADVNRPVSVAQVDEDARELERLEAEIAAAELRLAELQRLRAVRLGTGRSIQRISLYDWQRDALIAWDDAQRRGVVQAVTGAGKTRVGLAAIEDAHRQSRQSVVIVPTLALVKQWVAAIAELLPDVKVRSRVDSGTAWDVLVTTVQSAMRRPALVRSGGLLVADECHRYGAESYSLALNRAYEWRLGLTATLERGDQGDEILHGYFGGVCFDLGYDRATADRLIAPFKFAFASVPLSAQERAEYDQLDADLKAARLPLVQRYGVPESPVAEFLKGVSALAEDRTSGGGGGLARLYMARFARRKALLAETRMKVLALAGLSPAVRGSAGSIVFTQTQEAATTAAEVLLAAGCSAAAVHSDLGRVAKVWDRWVGSDWRVLEWSLWNVVGRCCWSQRSLRCACHSGSRSRARTSCGSGSRFHGSLPRSSQPEQCSPLPIWFFSAARSAGGHSAGVLIQCKVAARQRPAW